MTSVRVACVQVNAGLEVDENLAIARTIALQAAAAGAKLIAFPENVACVAQGKDKLLARAFDPAENTALAQFCDLARETGAWLLVGSLHVRTGHDMAANRSFLIDPSGVVTAWYDKIHMFDVMLAGGENYRESSTFVPGERLVVATLPWTVLGMTVCYDVRFAGLYRALAQAGAKLLSVPSAFTEKTGSAHWHTLLRARAIETGSFVIAPAQTGTHDGGRRTYGHSLIVGPWGDVLADAETNIGFVAADLDFEQVDKARAAIPSLTHDRPFAAPEL